MKRVALLIVFLALVSVEGRGEALRLAATIPLPGVVGRLDHMAIDAEGERLFIAALGNDSLEVIDVRGNRRVTTIKGLKKPQGTAFIREKNLIGVAAGEEGAFKVFSGVDYKEVSAVASLDDADNVRFNPASGVLFIGFAEGALALIDPEGWKKKAEITLGGHPESFQIASSGKMAFVNVPDSKEVVSLDLGLGRVTRRFPMKKFEANFPMALDEPNNRLFVGCRRPPRLVVLQTESGKELADAEISSDTDDLFFDAKRAKVYVSAGEGFIDVLSAPPGGALTRIERIPTRSGARTSFLSAELDRLFLAVPKHGNDPAEIRVYEPERNR